MFLSSPLFFFFFFFSFFFPFLLFLLLLVLETHWRMLALNSRKGLTIVR